MITNSSVLDLYLLLWMRLSDIPVYKQVCFKKIYLYNVYVYPSDSSEKETGVERCTLKCWHSFPLGN